MSDEIEKLLTQLHALEERIEERIEEQQAALRYHLREGRIEFEREVAERHRQLRTGLVTYLRTSPLPTLLISPLIYGLIVPIGLLDLSVCLYQAVCFRVWGIRRVKRSDFIVLDRHHLSYLNAIEKLNCVYCSYANGVIAYVRAVAARTEQYWCPIRHALRVKGAHDRYRDFLAYGDAEGWHRKLEGLRHALVDRGPS
jgi:hypothetical protein